MAINTEWLKKHWYYLAGGLLGLIVLIDLLSSSSGSASSSGADVSGGAGQLAATDAAANLEDAQVNGQVEAASYQANVANNQTAAALQLGEVQTAAELDATNQQTTSTQAVDIALGTDSVEANAAVVNGQVAENNTDASALEKLAVTATVVPLAQLAAVAKQVNVIQTSSKDAGKDYAAFAPIIAEETGQGGSATGLAQANTADTAVGPAETAAIAGTVGNTINTTSGQAANLFGKIFGGLF
jgi:hypothetical protein